MKNKILSIFLSTLLITVILTSVGSSNQTNDENPKMLIRIYNAEKLVLLPENVELVGGNLDGSLDIILTKSTLLELSDIQLNYDILIEDMDIYHQSMAGQYHTLAQMETILQDIANNYPSITDLYSIGTTYEGRDIWCLEISDNPGVDEGEPGVFFMGLHHAREWPTVEICLNIADELTSNYGSDPDITDIVNNIRIWLVTCVNPDGYYYCHDLGNDWRKNRRPVPGGLGIDLNRNYAGSSDGDPWGAWGSVGDGSISNNPSSEVYCGPSPFSEAETQAVRNIFLENDICASISWHTHGELVLIPWGYTYDDPPDDPYITQVGQQIAAQITKQSGYGTYTPQQAAVLYPTTGDTDDWAYGYAHYVQGRPTFSYTIEACSSFHPSTSYLDQIVAENFDGALELLDEVQNIYDNIIPRVIPPVIDELPVDPDGDYTVSWEEQNPDADPSKFQLDELRGPSIYTDDAESGSSFWSLGGFALSTTRYHSSSHSYKSGPNNNQVYTMTTVDSIPVSTGMELDFWCWYDIEYNYDMAFVEVSLNGRSFDVLDSFTGSSSGWVQKQYSLDDYNGESILVRFRYITDDYTLEEGFYVDDITPVVDWDSITTLSDTITNNYYDIIGKPGGDYYYRVKGYNSEYEWGDFSTLEKITVDILENDPPNTPDIDGPTSGSAGTSYEYTFTTTDPDDHDVYYYINWGDDQVEEWIGPYASGEVVTVSHTFENQGDFTISAKAKDVYDAESDWGYLDVTMPKNKAFNFNLLEWLFERFPNAFPIIRYILKL